MSQQKSTARYVLLGEIGAAHGIRGQVHIKSYTADPADIGAYGPLVDEKGERPLTITVERVSSKGVVGRVAGVPDRTAAEKLRGRKLYVSRDRLPAVVEGEYYHADLVGLTVVAEAGATVGEVSAVVNYGASDMLEIRRPGSRETELVPFTEAFIREVDLEGRRIVVAMPVMSADDEGDAGGSGEDASDAG